MSGRYSIGARGWTPAAFADGATLTDNNHHSARTTAATNVARIEEVYIGGEATTSTVNRMALRRIATNAGTPTNVAPTKLNPLNQAAAVFQGYVAATTDPVLAAAPTDLLNLAFNAFGGVVRWQAGPEEQVYFATATAGSAEIALSSISGTGIVTDHMIVEEL